MDVFDPSYYITAGGVLTCLGVLFTALWKGWLWTGGAVARLEKGYQDSLEAERERTDEWRSIALKSIANAEKVGPQLEALLAGQATQRAVLEALRSKASQT